MKFVSFSDTSTEKNVTYRYTKRGTNEPYCPDRLRERADGLNCYDKTNGNLFYNIEVSWMGEVLLDKFVDINVDLCEMQFVDHVYIKQTDDSKPGSIDIFTRENSRLKKIGALTDSAALLQKDITIPVGYYCDNVVVRINGAYEPVGIIDFDICSAVGIEKSVFPLPESITYHDGILNYDAITSYSCDCEEAEFASTYLCERLEERLGVYVSAVDSGTSITLAKSERDDDGFDITVFVIISQSKDECLYYIQEFLHYFL